MIPARIAGPLTLTEHPLQRTGARSIAALAGWENIADVTTADLDRIAERITGDVVRAAIAGKESVAYDWWKILFAMYPNAKPTHAKRTRNRTEMADEVAKLFAADPDGGVRLSCAFCEGGTAVVWAKSNLPMFDTTKALNTLPPGIAGWPVCRACRLSMWAMPYGASLTLGSATVLTCDDPAAERTFVETNLQRSARIRQTGFSALAADASPEAVTVRALEEHAIRRPVAATLWSFKNDNQEPWLRVTETRVATAVFLRARKGDRQAERGWRTLQRRLTRRGQGVRLSGRRANSDHSGNAAVVVRPRSGTLAGS